MTAQEIKNICNELGCNFTWVCPQAEKYVNDLWCESLCEDKRNFIQYYLKPLKKMIKLLNNAAYSQQEAFMMYNVLKNR